MKPNDKFSELIINKIVEEKIKPKSRRHFLLRDSVIWGVGIFSLIVGALSFAVLIYLFINNDWDIYAQITDSLGEFILLTLPYFWLSALGLFVFIVYYNIKHTKKGYRYPLPAVLVFSVIISVLLGGLFFKARLGRAIDDVLGDRAPFYTKVFNRQVSHWTEPEEGRLSGIVVSIVNDSEFLLLDLEKNEWRIISTRKESLPPDLIRVKRPVRLMGEIVAEDLFEVERIMPIGPGRKFFIRHGGMRLPSLKDIEMMEDHMENYARPRNRSEQLP